MNKGFHCISQEGLKLIACVCMLIDHVGAAIVVLLPYSFMPDLYYTCRIIGRLAFPIYAFLIAQGMEHTRNPGKYIARLAIGAALAEIPFDMLFEGGLTLECQSVMLTLLLGATLLLTQRNVTALWLKALLILPFAALAEMLHTDYAGMGVVMIAVFGMTQNRAVQLVGMALCNILMFSAPIPVLGLQIPIQLFAVGAMGLICLYSGEKRLRSKAVQWAFYLFYPVHILALWIVQGFVR